MSTAIKTKFNVDKIETSESLKLGGTTATSLIDSSTVTSIGTSSSVALSIVQNAGNPSAKIYDSAELLPGSADSGSMALVTETNRLYIWNGTGWYNIALVNTSPTLSTTPDSNYTMDSVGASLTVTMVASDPEELPITYSYLSDSASNFVSITQDSGVFTISSLTQAQLDSNGVSSGGTFSITFRATDGVNIAPAVSSFTLTLAVTYDWSTTSQANKITASDAANNDFFGNVVDIDGDYAVVGARGNKAVYIYKASDLSWAYGQQQANFQGADVGGNSFYGQALEISNDGNTTAVGARGDYAIYVHTRSGSTWSQQQKITVSGQSGHIGRVVSLSGDGDTVAFSDAIYSTNNIGRVYVWTRSGSTWSSETIIEYDDADADLDSGDRFGSSLALTDDGNTLVIGCFKEDQDGSNTGGVYVFTRSGSTWSFQQRLQSNPVITNSEFGNERHGVGISGDGNYIVVGAGGSNKSHVFNLSGGTWSQQAILTPSGGSPGTNAPSVDISQSGDTVIVGVPLSDGEASNAGAAYVFTRSGSTWTQEARLNHSTAASNDYFGWDVGISNDGNTAIVSAYADDISSSTDAGSAFVFTRSGTTWTQQKELNQSTVYAESYFGYQSRISGDATTAIVSANGYDTLSSPYDVGMVYIYEQARQWTEQTKIQETTFGSNFGHSVSISGDTVVVGSNNTDVNSPDGTKSYVYTRASYNLTNASYASKTYSFASVDNGPTGFAFNSDGTKLFFVGWQQTLINSTTGGCYQYSLSTAYDVSTATYDNVSLDLSSQMTQPMGMNFSSDGTKLFVLDNQASVNGDVVFQYNLSTAFDLSTASYSNNSLDVSSYETIASGIDFKPDGTKMFVVGEQTDTIRAWNLSSAWDLSTASYASETYSVSSQDGLPTGFTFNSTGTKMYFVGRTNHDIYQYSLSTAWDVSTASYDSISLDVSSQEGDQPRQIRFNSDGSKLWMIGSVSDSIFEYSVPETWSLQQKVDPSQAHQDDQFGKQRTMKLDKSNNNQFIAGAYSEDESYSAEGAVYIFTRSGSTWSEQQRIVPSDGAINSNYGITADISGDYAVFGGRPGNNFAVYVWTRSGSTWSQQTKLTQPSGHTNSQYAYDSGLSINQAGDTIAVGAYGNSSTQAGKVFIFTRSGSTWTNQAVIQPSDTANGDFFGWECRLDSTGDILVVGAKTAGTGGKAYVFTRDGATWTQQANITASDVASNWEFGEDVGISGGDGRLIVGARQYSSSASGKGAAYIFTASES